MNVMVGKILGNRYELLEKIGEGGMAYVYKAKCLLLNRMVAVKILRPEFVKDEEFIAKFDHESQAAASLSHHNIVNIYDVGNDDDVRYIVMELVEGKTLKEYIKETDGFMSNEEMMKISFQIAKALEHAHNRNIIHRDIKPHNILISKKGMVKVADFGIARAVTSSTVISNSEVIGSVHYASPEQSRGGYVDARSDIYSFGVLMYEMATKKVPFEGDTPITVALKHLKEKIVVPSNFNPDLNKGFESVIIKALQKDTSSRYQSAKELIGDLEKLINNPDENVPFYITAEDSPTIILPNMAELEIEPEEEKKKSKMIIIGIVLAAFVVSAIVFGLMAFNSIRGSLKSSVVTVPSVVNMPYEEAVNTLQGLGLYADISDKKFDADIEKGSVISQLVEEGSTVKEGYTVSLVVSNGSITTKVPNVLQKELSDAKLIIENSKLIVGTVDYVQNDLPRGYILEQSPKPGINVSEDSEVNLKVSEGKKILTVIMPKVVGKTIDDAQKSLSQIKLRIGNISYNFSSEYTENIVISQGISSGAEINEGTYVDIVVSKGKDPDGGSTEPTTGTGVDVPATGTGENTPTTSETGELVEKKFHIPLSKFENSSGILRVDLIQNGIPKVVYEKEHQRSDERVRVVIKAKGEAIIKSYYDGVEGDTINEVF